MTEDMDSSIGLRGCGTIAESVNSGMLMRAIVAGMVVCAPLLRAQCPNGTPIANCTAVRPARVVPPAPSARARQIALLPFRNVTRAPANDWLVTGAPLLLGEI